MEMKVTEGMKPVDLNPDRLYWTRGDSFKVFAAALRVFYLEGEPAHETIGKLEESDLGAFRLISVVHKYPYKHKIYVCDCSIYTCSSFSS